MKHYIRWVVVLDQPLLYEYCRHRRPCAASFCGPFEQAGRCRHDRASGMSGYSHRRCNGKNVVNTLFPAHPKHCGGELLINSLGHLDGKGRTGTRSHSGIIVIGDGAPLTLARFASWGGPFFTARVSRKWRLSRVWSVFGDGKCSRPGRQLT